MIEQSLKITLLYVEDNYMIQMMIKSFLSGEGFEVLIADNGAQALHYIFDENLSIDALLTDVNLGDGANGWEVARCARLRTPMMPVIYTSSVTQDEWVENGVPFSRLCAKPFRPSHILDALASFMGARTDLQTIPILAWSPIAALPLALNPAVLEVEQIAAIETVPLGPKARAGDKTWVVGPLGQRLYKKNLPSPNCQWTSRRKAEVVAAFAGGLLSTREVHGIYGLSVEEFAGWQRAVERFGMPGLKQTRTKQYREFQQRTQRFGWAG